MNLEDAYREIVFKTQGKHENRNMKEKLEKWRKNMRDSKEKEWRRKGEQKGTFKRKGINKAPDQLIHLETGQQT